MDKTLDVIQKRYLDLLNQKKSLINSPNCIDVCKLFDEIEIFWRSNINEIEFCLSRLTCQHDVRLFCASDYLGIDTKRPYEFKFLGRVHVVSDSILKYEPFIRQDGILTPNISRDLTKIFWDTIYTIQNYNDQFLFLPIQILIQKTNPNHEKELTDLIWLAISKVFGVEINNQDDFLNHFNTIEAIDCKLKAIDLKSMMLYEGQNQFQDLFEVLNGYIQYHDSYLPNSLKKVSPNLFINALVGIIGRVFEIVNTASQLEMIPYLRSKMYISWMLTLFPIFIKDPIFGNLIKHVIIHFVAVNNQKFKKIASQDFDLFINTIRKNEYNHKIICKAMDMFEGARKPTLSEIDNLINTIIDA